MNSRVLVALLIVGLVIVVVGAGIFLWKKTESRGRSSINVVITNTIDDQRYAIDVKKFLSGTLLREVDNADNPYYVDTIRVELVPTLSRGMSGSHRYTHPQTGEDIIASAVGVSYLSQTEELLVHLYLHEAITSEQERIYFINSSFVNAYFYGLELYKGRTDGSYSADYTSASRRARSVFETLFSEESYFIYADT